MSKIRVCFLGTPEFAVTALKGLLADEHFEVVGVVTQPDRPSGRKLQLTPSPIKTLALQNNLKVISPESLKKDPEATEIIKSWSAEVGVVVAFGQILTEEFINLFHFSCVNIHGSLLPRWRGAAPIQRAIEAGDAVTGVTLQKIVKRLDAGDILGVRRLELDENINATEVYKKLSELGTELLHVELMDYIRGHLGPVPQDESQVTYAKKIEKSESAIDWNLSARKIHNKVRAFVAGPGSHTELHGKKLKIIESRLAEKISRAQPGQIVPGDTLMVQTGEGVLELITVQPESRSRMSGKEYLKGYSSGS